MRLRLPTVPMWAVVSIAAIAGTAAIAADFVWPRHAMGPPLEAERGFYAGAGFAAAALVLAGAWLARLLRGDA